MAAHKHAEFIKAWADGVTVQVATTNGWQSIGNSPSWSECNEYRIKPAEPERVYPVTQMSEEEIQAAWGEPYGWKGLCVFANAALRHACDAGQIVTREEFDRAVGDRKARDMAVAEAVAGCVRRYMVDHGYHSSALRAVDGLNLPVIIAEVGK